MIVEGKVQQVIERPTKFGSYFDLVVDGRKYGVGKKRPPCFDGDWVQFEAEAKGDFWNADPTSFKKIPAKEDEGPAQPAPKAYTKQVASKIAGGGLTKDDYWNNKEKNDEKRQEAIAYQAARNSAIDFTRLLVEAGKVDFGKMKGNEAIGMLETYVDKYTIRFHEDTKNLGHKSGLKAVSEEEPFNDSVEDI